MSSIYFLPPEEQAEIYGLAHLEIADRGRMDAVAAIVRRVDEIGVRGAADDLIEIEDAVESGFRADPLVDLIANLRFAVIPTRIVRSGKDIVTRNDSRADYLDAFRLEPR